MARTMRDVVQEADEILTRLGGTTQALQHALSEVGVASIQWKWFIQNVEREVRVAWAGLGNVMTKDRRHREVAPTLFLMTEFERRCGRKVWGWRMRWLRWRCRSYAEAK